MTDPADARPGAVARTTANAVAWIVETRARSALVLFVAILLAIAAVLYGRGIKVNTDLRALLPKSAPSVHALDTIEARKGSAEQLVVAVESPDDAANAAMVDEIGAEVASWPETTGLTVVRDFTPLRDHALYFLDVEQLIELRDTLADQHKRAVAKAMGPGLTEDPIDINAVNADDWDESGGDDDLDWGPPEGSPPEGSPPEGSPPEGSPPENAPPENAPPDPEVEAAFNLDQFLTEQRADLVAQGVLDAKEVDLVWPRENEAGEVVWDDHVGQPYVNDAGDVRVLKASLTRPATDVEFAQEVVKRIEARVADAKSRGIATDARVEVVAAYDVSKEVDTIVRDAARATWISASLIIAVLVIGFWSLRALALVLVPMAVSMAMTLAVAALVYGQLNALTVFLFAVLFGMGVDFAVHLYALRQAQGPTADWPEVIASHLRPLSATMLTTVGSLAVLGLAEFQAFREFGLISAVGVLICFIAALFLVPAIDTLLGPLRRQSKPKPARAPGLRVPAKLLRPLRFARVALLIGVGVYGLFGMPKVAFEKDTRALRSTDDDATLKINYGSTGGRCAKTLALIADDPAELDEVVARIEAEKTKILPGAIDTGEPREPWIRDVYSLGTLMPTNQAAKQAAMEPIIGLTNDFLAELPDLGPDEQKYRTHLEALERLSKVKPLASTELPDWALEPFTEKDGRSDRIAHVCLEIAGWSIDELVAVRTRIDELTAGTGVLPADSRLVFADLMVLVERDARSLPVWALLIILIFIALDLRAVAPTLICFASLALGLIFTLGVMGTWPLRLNFFNLVVMPAVVGLGIDASIHLWHARTRTDLGATSRASLLAALTTVAGFSGLLAAHHLGLRSIGEVGILALVICVSVAFLTLYPLRARD